VATVAHYEPMAVLLDIGLPDIDRYNVRRAIRTQPNGKDAKIVALTGWGDEEDRARSAEAGLMRIW
jgi:CheY-like chemotaxis protein